ncbi:MAG TPA: dTDP-4-dehydrorhamnose 3,5-epimerase [Acidimicrobiia bacterium]|nr:dTDP-4-dehydrorhamnose 3,5-epimerase [Acidimicrobiia bacterium]
MKFTESPLPGLWLIETEPVHDHRGFFARTWSDDEFAEHGLVAAWPQQNLQYSPRPGTMRGLHYQVPPHAEVKLVRCTRGRVYDVALDLRPESQTFGKWAGNYLSPDEHKAVWVPQGFAHGYLTIEPHSEVFYLTSNKYVPASVRGVRYDDPTFAISWPIDIELVPTDYVTWPDFNEDRTRELSPPSDGDGWR